MAGIGHCAITHCIIFASALLNERQHHLWRKPVEFPPLTGLPSEL
ncbi:MAG: hypothetical protein K0S56_3705 [Microvirga sp.]|jgi:hypothetical protein|nr:hypothetical protein [Microvirga sp.]